MGAQHTPGPWMAQTFAVYDAAHRLIAHVGGTRHPIGDHVPEQEANARLIAAAPELLERLREVLSLFGNPCPYDSATTRTVALQLIARIEGTE